ncbi:hypothetical protein HQQ81_16525 [Microbacteriaceae bacterium VKM Ac-2854]|nr:hypothetical protein [Microbacteriaceae bacterium VKM Ac-2854]
MRIVGATAIVLSTITLGAVVNGEVVQNRFVVTEVYVMEAVWRLASLSFTKRLDGVD